MSSLIIVTEFNNINQVGVESENILAISEVQTGPQGVAGTSLLKSGLAADLKLTGPIILDWTPDGPAVINGFVIRASSISSVITPPTISIRRDDDEVFLGPQLLNSLANGKGRFLSLGTMPLMDDINQVKIVLNTPANAGNFSVLIDVLGYYY
jgi:hypothetical protein